MERSFSIYICIFSNKRAQGEHDFVEKGTVSRLYLHCFKCGSSRKTEYFIEGLFHLRISLVSNGIAQGNRGLISKRDCFMFVSALCQMKLSK